MSGRGVEFRSFSWNDFSTIEAIIHSSDASDGLECRKSGAELRTAWESPTADPERNAFVVLVGSQVAGYGRIQLRASEDQTGYSKILCLGRVLPAWRGQGIGADIVSECEMRARARIDELPAGTVFLEAYADERQEDVRALFASFGLRPVRRFFDMVYQAAEDPPQPVYPPGYRARVPGNRHDEETMWRVMDTAFADHWGHIYLTLDEWMHWVDSELFDSDLSLLAVGPDGDAVGACLCVIDSERNSRRGREEGWIDWLGILPGHRGRGLGRALLLEGMHRLRQQGCTHLMLDVDGDNPTGALHLYESLGFRECRVAVTFQKLLRG